MNLALAAAWQLYAPPHLACHVFRLDALSGSLDPVTSLAGARRPRALPPAGVVLERRRGRGLA